MENKENLQLLETMRVELEAALADRDKLSQRILQDELRVDERVAERVGAERDQNKLLTR
jgi:hypothetical protein